MSLALYRRWRPQTWDEVVGQEHVVQTLRHAVRADHVAHAYLFAGPRGTGKTTTARLLAKAVNCIGEASGERPCNRCDLCLAVNDGRFLDLIEIDAASNTSVDDVRELRERINFAPNQGRFKVYIIDEVHMLSTAAFNALLKTLEEPPAHAIFVLATTEVHKIPATVLSRCQRHEFRRVPVSTMVSYLSAKSAAEGIVVETQALEVIARQATGSVRDAISLLDQLASTGEAVTLAGTHDVLGTVASEAVRHVTLALTEHNAGEGLTHINAALDAGADPRQFARQLVDYLRAALIVKLESGGLLDLTPEARAELVSLAAHVSVGGLLSAIQAFNHAANDSRSAWQPGLALEMAFIEAAGLGSGRDTIQTPPARAAQPAAPNEGPERPTPNRQPSRSAAPHEGPEHTASNRLPSPPGDRGPSVPLASTGESLNFTTLRGQWSQVLAAAYRRDPRTQALLNSGRPLGLEGGTLVLGFTSDLLRERMEKKENLAMVRQSMEEVFGRAVPIRCVLAKSWRPPGAEEQSTDAIEDGGMVATAVRDLGAQVVDVKHLPPETHP